MSLSLPHCWEHALVAAVVDAVKSSRPQCYLGRTAIQKLVYFLHVLGVPMRFRFRMYHYGPFCDELAGTLDWLQADDVVVDGSRESRYSNYSTGANWPELKMTFREGLLEHQKTIISVADALGAMDPNILELISTLDFSFRWVHARGGVGPWQARTVEKFKQIKGTKFSDTEISDWYDRLVQAKLIQS